MDKNKQFKTMIISVFLLLFFALPTFKTIHPIFHEEPLVQANADFNEESAETSNLEEFVTSEENMHPQWNHNIMNIGQAWADGFTGEGIRIAILDTGFFHNHPDLTMAGGDSVFPGDPWSNDHSGHGTHIAGIIGAHPGTTYQGIAPGADLFGIKIYHQDDVDENGFVSTSTQSVAQGVQLAMNLDVDIIVISSGLSYHDEELYEQIQAAHAEDIMIIAASGNGSTTVNYPAHYPEVLAVTAIDERLQPAHDIIQGQENEFAAPGVNIGGLSIPESAYSYPYIFMSGSSQAAPHAAGMAAILMQKYNVRGEEARQIMQQQATDIGEPELFGHGLLRYIPDEEVAEEGGDSEDPAEEPAEEPAGLPEVPIEEEGIAIREPTSSRTADPDDDGEIALAYHQTEAILQGSGGAIDEATIPLVETGGTLEVWLDTLSPLYLNEEQIAEIRERNITLVLARENVTWTIPPANLLPGEATLEFYEGLPENVEEPAGAETSIYTTSIFQEDVSRISFPGWMEVRFDLSQTEHENLEELAAYYWNAEEEAWLPSESIVDGSSVILRTRHTSALGFFDPEQAPEVVAEENPSPEVPVQETTASNEDETENGFELSTQLIIGLLIFSVLLIIVGVYFRRKSKRK
jgi:hypothetical protein